MYMTNEAITAQDAADEAAALARARALPLKEARAQAALLQGQKEWSGINSSQHRQLRCLKQTIAERERRTYA